MTSIGTPAASRVGGGLETAVTDKVTVNLEYRYSQFADEDFDTGGVIEVEPFLPHRPYRCEVQVQLTRTDV